MKHLRLFLVVTITGALFWGQSPLIAQQLIVQPEREDYLIVGSELGATGAPSPLDRYVDNGATLAPFAGYMFNRFIGVMGQFHIVAMPNKDACEPSGCPGYDPDGCDKNKPEEDDSTWALGATVGPRLALPIGGIELWGTFQAGGFTGLSGDSPISDTSWAFSTGGGANVAITDRISVGGFARYNRLYQEAHGHGDVRYAAGGISFTYKLPPPQSALPQK